MLAAECAWRILRAEHAQLRQLLASIRDAMEGGRWSRPGQDLTSLRWLLQCLYEFDNASHRPKGFTLLDTMRGRCAEADALIASLELERQHADSLLLQVLRLLDAIEQGNATAAAECAAMLEQYQSLMLRHLDQEDTALYSHTAQLLTAEEWSRVISSISRVLYATGDLPGDTSEL